MASVVFRGAHGNRRRGIRDVVEHRYDYESFRVPVVHGIAAFFAFDKGQLIVIWAWLLVMLVVAAFTRQALWLLSWGRTSFPQDFVWAFRGVAFVAALIAAYLLIHAS